MTEQQELIGDTETPAPESGRRRAVLLGGAVAVVAALGVGAYVLLGAGDSQDSAVRDAQAGITHLATSTAHASPAVTVTPAPIVATQPNRHDPFKPLYTPKPVPTTAAVTPTTVPTVPGTLPTVPGGTVGPGASGTPGALQTVVKLQSISGAAGTPTVTVAINGVSSTGKTGEILGAVLQIVSIRSDDGAATFQLGEATFDLHIGQTYTN